MKLRLKPIKNLFEFKLKNIKKPVPLFYKDLQNKQIKKMVLTLLHKIKITTKHIDEATSKRASTVLAEKLTANLGKSRVLGPEPPLVERVRNQFLFDILIKLEREKINFKAAKSFIQEKVTDILTDKTLKSIQVVIDVDCL